MDDFRVKQDVVGVGVVSGAMAAPGGGTSVSGSVTAGGKRRIGHPQWAGMVPPVPAVNRCLVFIHLPSFNRNA